ncbi:hypothetical protein ACW9UR_02790 [Halovulum sp. GXIMD14794]
MIWSAAPGRVWIILVSAVALIPNPQHRPYAAALPVPCLLLLIAADFSVLWTALFLVCVLSIYRYGAHYLLGRAAERLRESR